MACTDVADSIEELEGSESHARLISADEIDMQQLSSLEEVDIRHSFSTREKLFYTKVLETLWNEAKSHPKGFLKTIARTTPERDALPALHYEYAPNTVADKRIDTMRRLVCSPICAPSLCSINNLTAVTPSLKSAQAKGWNFLGGFVIPDILRPLYLCLALMEVFFAFLAILIAIPTIAVFATESVLAFYDVVFLIVSLKWLILSILYIVTQRRREAHQHPLEDETGLSDEESHSQSMACHNRCLCKCFGSLHFIVTRVDVYALLFLSIFGGIHTSSYEFATPVQALGGIRFLWACLSFFVFIFVAQFVVVARAIYILRKMCRFLPYLQTRFSYLLFTLYTFGQAVTLVILVTSLGARFYYDKVVKSTNLPFSPELFFMVVAGFLINMLGPCIFFHVNTYWVQGSIITICMSVLRALQTPECMQSIQRSNQDPEEIRNKVSVVMAYMNPQTIITDYRKMKQNVPMYYKAISGAFNPLSVIICMIYSALLACFIICSIHSDGGFTEILDSSVGAQVLFAFLTGGLFVCNISAFVTSVVWIPVALKVTVFYLGIKFHAFCI